MNNHMLLAMSMIPIVLATVASHILRVPLRPPLLNSCSRGGSRSFHAQPHPWQQFAENPHVPPCTSGGRSAPGRFEPGPLTPGLSRQRLHSETGTYTTQGCQARLTEPVGRQCSRPDPARATTGASSAVDHSRSRPGRVKPISLVHRAPGLLISVLLSRSSSRARAAIVRMARTRAKGTRHVECPANGTIRGRRGG